MCVTVHCYMYMYPSSIWTSNYYIQLYNFVSAFACLLFLHVTCIWVKMGFLGAFLVFIIVIIMLLCVRL